jgi:hypothetical protein
MPCLTAMSTPQPPEAVSISKIHVFLMRSVRKITTTDKVHWDITCSTVLLQPRALMTVKTQTTTVYPAVSMTILD